MLEGLTPIDDWGLFPKGKRPVVISGPCSAESEEVVMNTASALKEIGVTVFRAGIWKPRTHPNTFEGVGEVGLLWLNKVQRDLKMKVIIEVATTNHVDLALKHNIDALWIGARTTANPFAVQEIAQSLKGCDIPVLIKNPTNPELELWIGAVERVYNCNIRKIGVVHRGFSFYEKMRYRNSPYWQIPIELRRRFPQLPILSDPSHIGGGRKYVQEISDMALNLGFDGLMVESHISPDSALSDANQQITPCQLKDILETIRIRSERVEDGEISAILDDMRGEIDRLDSHLVDLLSLRMDVVRRIGDIKREHNITILQTARWNEVLNNVLKLADSKNLDKNYIEKLFKLIHQASIESQTLLEEVSDIDI